MNLCSVYGVPLFYIYDGFKTTRMTSKEEIKRGINKEAKHIPPQIDSHSKRVSQPAQNLNQHQPSQLYASASTPSSHPLERSTALCQFFHLAARSTSES